MGGGVGDAEKDNQKTTTISLETGAKDDFVMATANNDAAIIGGAEQEDDLLLVDTEIEERLRDPTLHKCDFCVAMYVKEVPPKRPLSPFIFFSQEQRKILKTKNQQWSTKQVMKHLQKAWRNMTATQTQKYRDMSDLDRNRYDRHRKFLKEGVKPGAKCDCINLPARCSTFSDQYQKLMPSVVVPSSKPEPPSIPSSIVPPNTKIILTAASAAD